MSAYSSMWTVPGMSKKAREAAEQRKAEYERKKKLKKGRKLLETGNTKYNKVPFGGPSIFHR